jgi:predicted secreted protein
LNNPRRTAIFAIASIAMGLAASTADAKTVSNGANRSTVPLTRGESLLIKLAPADSGSTGYHWRVAKKPAQSVLRLTAHRQASDGKQELFRYKARRGGVANLELQYVSPGRDRRVAKRFALTTVVNAPEPKLDCSATGGSPTVAESGQARVFRVRRSAWVSRGSTGLRVGYDAYYGCANDRETAFRLGNIVDLISPHEFWNITLRGSLVGFVHGVRCPLNGDGCERGGLDVQSQDLRTGKVIRDVGTGSCGPGCDNTVTGLVMSASGGLAWIERSAYEDPTHNLVLRSDAPSAGGETVSEDPEILDLDEKGEVDPDSLERDGGEMTWLRGGKLQRAALR